MATNLPESFQLIFHDSPLGVAVVLNTDRGIENGLLLYANPSLLRMFERWRPGQYELTGMIATLCADMSSGENTHETKITLDDGQVMWVEVRLQPTVILEESGHFFWVTDITTAKTREEMALADAKMADAAAQAKSNFLATMSHEIRTPLQTIFGMLELLTEENPTEKQSDMIASAKNSANGLLGILDDILDLAKVDAGKMELDYFEMPLRTLVYGIIESLESKRRENNLYLKADIEPDVPFVVMGDPKRLRQILTNLIGNGLKFTEKGGLTIRVLNKTRHIKPMAGHIGLRFEVVDTGIGMTADVAAKLFQPFTQADNSTTRRFGGTGLGLSIAHRLVETMGGQIGVISEPGKGSTFWFEIPTQIASEKTEVKLPDLTGLTVLSIEDHPKGSLEIKNSLQSMGANVTSVGTLADGLDLVEKRPFDVAVIDNGLPDGWGVDAMKKINKLRPFMGLILYTVHDDYEVKQICKFLGATYLGKPASRRGLGEAVKGAAKQPHRVTKDGPRRLLVCEDNDSVRDIIKKQLEKLGIAADFAPDGAVGWDIIQQNKHGLVITDLHMPNLDGYGLVKHVRQREADGALHLPVIAMTADVQLMHEQTYLKHGFDECLLKPVSLGQVRQLLVRWGLLEERHESEADTTLPANTTPVLPNKPVIDPAMAEAQFGAFDDDAKSMIGLFISMSEKQVTDMGSAYKKNEWAKLKSLAHSLKGAARSACCPQLGDVAEAIQKYSEAGNVPADTMAMLVPAFDAVRTEYDKIKV